FVLGDEVEPALCTLDRIDQLNSDFGAQIGRARRLGAEIEARKSARRAGAAAWAGAASETACSAAAEELRKEIAEIAAAEVCARARAGCRLLARIAAHHLFLRDAVLPIGAELVVLLALVGVADDLVGLVQLLEFGLGILVVGIYVGMEFAGELAVGAFDFRPAGFPIDPESFVVVAKFHPEYSVASIRNLSYYTHLLCSISKLRPAIT